MEHDETKKPTIYSIGQLTQRLQTIIRDRFQDIWLAGEVSNVITPSSGHIYLTLKDKNAQLKAVIWRSDAELIDFPLKDGMQVICRGDLDVYPPRGTYQLNVRHLELRGQGAQQQALKLLKSKLQKEGLFDSQRKQRLPEFPTRIAVVTSPSGAAIRDFLKVIARRWPAVEVVIIPARVQGDESGLEVAQGVVVAGRLAKRPDVVVVTRGGGSAEDLSSFNDERVVRAIAACTIPVISGVGHEVDVTLSDLAADVRALTPSVAAELAVPNRADLLERVTTLKERMQRAVNKSFHEASQQVERLQARRVMKDMAMVLATPQRRVDELEFRLRNSAVRLLERSEGQLTEVEQRLTNAADRWLVDLQNRLNELEIKLQHAGDRAVEAGQNQMAVLAGRLQAISPLAVLSRGYSVTFDQAGVEVRDAKLVNVGDEMITRLQQGEVKSSVIQVTESDE